MVKRTFRIRRELDALLDRLVQDPKTYYKSLQDYVHHAVLALTDAFIKAGYPDMALRSEKEYEDSLRLQAHETARQRDMANIVHSFEEGIELARVDGDWKTLEHYLEMFSDWVREAP